MSVAGNRTGDVSVNRLELYGKISMLLEAGSVSCCVSCLNTDRWYPGWPQFKKSGRKEDFLKYLY